ncbi:uclacyanin-2-like [Impatiens glandulifera]|uniref:uclacyanin-2-like n=1 Tax=Impatiens glandulifera TaxID=253017 RepID=UPI001FB0D7D7|nr:uclacyanin-2-like [Impatiens glandulifera]
MEPAASYNNKFHHHFSLLLFLAVISCFGSSVGAYTNYTVGGSLGWYDKLLKPTVDYQKWLVGKNFSLGDFLIFNSDSNHSVIQTYNFNTYKRCDYNNDQDNDTTQWSGADPSSTTPQPVTVSVPLVKVGMNYFFSSDYDGEQCKNGQRFKVNVTYGQGLPPSLLDSPDSSPAPISPESGDSESAPDTLVPSNFNNPKDIDQTDDVKSIATVVTENALIGVLLMLLGINLLGLN